MTKKDEQHIDPALRAMSSSPAIQQNSHSPTPSQQDHRSSRRSSPHPYPPYYDRYRQDHHHHHHHSSGYLYAPHFDPRYEHHPHPHYHLPPPDPSGHHYSPTGLPTHYIPGPASSATQSAPPPSPYSHHYGPVPPQNSIPIVHTSDANTKLSDGIRRRCFNCCTTDTSTWRRSNLSPGKVLCNKCGLFERTHSRPRPEQFPHKRGALASSNLRGRSPSSGHAPQTQLPSLAAATGPYQYHHAPINPLSAQSADYPQHLHPSHHQQQLQQQHINTLPGLQSWHANSPSVNPVSNGASTPPQQQPSNSTGSTSEQRQRSLSPRVPSAGSTTPVSVSAGRLIFDDRATAVGGVGGDPHLRSLQPSPPLSLSRSSTTTSNHPQESHAPPSPRDSQA